MKHDSYEIESTTPETAAILAAREARERAAVDFDGPVVPETITIDGREYKVIGKPLAVLMQDLSLMAPPEIVVPYIAAVGRVTMLAAREKLGKSTLAAFLAAMVSCGREVWGHAVKRGSVLWVGLEEDKGDAVRRFGEMNANAWYTTVIGPYASENAIGQLEAEIVAHQARLVVIDSLAAFFRDVDDENGAAAWTKNLMPLIALARKHRTAIMLLHHANRAQGTYRGSSAIGAAMDMIIEMTEDEKDLSVRHLRPRGRWSVKPFSVRFQPSKEFTLVGDDTPTPEAVREAKRDALQESVHAWLIALGRAASLSEIRKAASARASACDEALDALVTAGRVRHLGKRKGYEAVAPVVPGPRATRPSARRAADGQLDIGL